MPSVTGAGGSFGGAVRAALSAVSLGTARPSYDRKSPAAQYRQLQRTEAGRRALDLAGVTPAHSTARRWLSHKQRPSKANAEAIGQAYAAARAGGIPAWVKQGDMTITGTIKTGGDVRDRSLLVKGDQVPPLAWEPIEREWRELDDDELADLVAEYVVGGALDGVSEPWEFPGAAYSVSFVG